MPVRETAPKGAPCWIDLGTSDEDTTRKFYSALFGWTANEGSTEFGGYYMWSRGEHEIAGGMPMPEAPNAWVIYLSVDDARATLDRAAANGGQVVVPAMDIADLGTMGVIVDPAGAAIGVWQPKAFPGFQVVTEAGAPSYFELHTRDYDGALKFYAEVFGWDIRTVSDTPEFRYSQPYIDDMPQAGIIDASGFAESSQWLLYFGTDDADATANQAEKLGAKVIEAPVDTPYGRLAELTDPNGARFKLVAPNAAMPAK